MSVPFQIEGPKIVERLPGRGHVNLAIPNVASQRLHDLHVREVGDVKAHGGIGDPGGDGAPLRRAQEQLDQAGGVEDDHLALRSARISAETLSEMFGLISSRFINPSSSPQ